MTSQKMTAESGQYFSKEGADVGEQETITAPKRKGRPKGSKNKPRVPESVPERVNPVLYKPKPSAPELGKQIVEFCAAQYDWKPSDWRHIVTSMVYAARHGKLWHSLTSK